MPGIEMNNWLGLIWGKGKKNLTLTQPTICGYVVMLENNLPYYRQSLISSCQAPPCSRKVLLTTEWWTVCTHLTSVTTITRALGCREEPLDTLPGKGVRSVLHGMRNFSFIKRKWANSGASKRCFLGTVKRNVTSPCHSPGEKHSWAYSNNIKFHWEKNRIAQWCSKHGERNLERGIKTIKTSMLRHCSSWN